MVLVILAFIVGGICIGFGAAGIIPIDNKGSSSGVIAGVVLILLSGGCGFIVFMEAGHSVLAQTTTISSPLYRKIAVQHVTVAVQP